MQNLSDTSPKIFVDQEVGEFVFVENHDNPPEIAPSQKNSWNLLGLWNGRSVKSATPSYLSNFWNSLWPAKSVKAAKELPFDKGQHLRDIVTKNVIDKQILLQGKDVISAIGQYTSSKTLQVEHKTILWSDILVGDLHRMIGAGQLKINGETLTLSDSSLSNTDLAERVVRKIYQLTGDEEMTHLISGLMCQSMPNFLFHSTRRHLKNIHFIEPIQSSDAMKTSYHLKVSDGPEKHIQLSCKMNGNFEQGIIEHPTNGIAMIEKAASLKSRIDINLNQFVATVAYKTKVCDEAINFSQNMAA